MINATDVSNSIYALNFSSWKRAYVRLCFPDAQVHFISHLKHLPTDGVLVAWGNAPLPAGIRLIRIEDGFLRSVGLGADLIRPLSWSVDRQGIYYDATRPSGLETILATEPFDDALIARAHTLRQRIVAARLTKYNVGQQGWQPPAGEQRILLVPGQVESDASLAFGAPGIRRNMELLQAVRTANPEAYIVYKPHPDVVARLRAAGADEDQAEHWCDEVVVDVSMDQLLDAVHEVHVLTSLTGFEALLREVPVTCYGLPFYAGWGLTTDVLAAQRRSRMLSLDQLVAGALICFPCYFDRQGKMLVSAEAALGQLATWRAKEGGKTPWWRHLFRIILRRVVGVR